MEVVLEQLQGVKKTIIKINTIIPYFNYRNSKGIIVKNVESALNL